MLWAQTCVCRHSTTLLLNHYSNSYYDERNQSGTQDSDAEGVVRVESCRQGAPGRLRGALLKGRQLAARKIKPLPTGSVEFDHAIAEGVTDMVVRHPMVGAWREMT